MLADLDVRFRVMDAFDDYSRSCPADAADREHRAWGRRAGARARQRRHGGAGQHTSTRFPAFIARCHSTIRMPRCAAIRAIDTWRARHQISRTSTARRFSAAVLPIFETLAARDADMAAPYRGADMPDFKAEARSEFEIWWTFGWPYGRSAAMRAASPVIRSVSNLKITHHMGAMAPYFAGRVGPGWDQLGPRRRAISARAAHARAAARLLQDVLADTALFGACTLRSAASASSAPTTCFPSGAVRSGKDQAIARRRSRSLPSRARSAAISPAQRADFVQALRRSSGSAALILGQRPGAGCEPQSIPVERVVVVEFLSR